MGSATKHKIILLILKGFGLLAAIGLAFLFFVDDATVVGEAADPAESILLAIVSYIFGKFIKRKKISWGLDKPVKIEE